MKVEFLKSFSKDIDAIPSKKVKQSLINLLEMLERAEDLTTVPNIKKLKDFKNAYRIRVGDYRLGFFWGKFHGSACEVPSQKRHL